MMSRKSVIAASKVTPSSPLFHTLRSGRSFSSSRQGQDIRTFMLPVVTVPSTSTVVSVGSEASHLSIATSSTHSSCAIVREEKWPQRKSVRQQKRSTSQAEGPEIEITDSLDGSDDVIITGISVSSPPKVAKTVPPKLEKPARGRPKKQTTFPVLVKAESATPSKSSKPASKSSRRGARSAVPSFTVATRTRSRIASESDGRNSGALTAPPTELSPPTLVCQESALKTESTIVEEPSLLSPVKAVFLEKASPSEIALSNIRSGSDSIQPELTAEKGSEQVEELLETVEMVQMIPPAAKKVLKRRLKRLQRKLRKSKPPRDRKPKTNFDYVRAYSKSKFTLPSKNSHPVKSNDVGRVKSLFEVAFSAFFRETMAENWPKNPALFSNKVATEILPKIIQSSAIIRKKATRIARFAKFLTLICADKRANVHLLKEISTFLASLVGIGHNPTNHALVDFKLSRQLPLLFRLYRTDWQAALKLARGIFFKDKLALRQTGCFLLFDRLKSLVRPRNCAALDDSLESCNKLRLSHVATLLTAAGDTNFVELKPPSRAFGIVRILQCLFAHFSATMDYEDEEMGQLYGAIKQCRVANKQTIRGYAEASRIQPETQRIADEWESLYDSAYETALACNMEGFTTDDYKTVLGRSRVSAEQVRIIYCQYEDPVSSDSYEESGESEDEDRTLEVSQVASEHFEDSVDSAPTTESTLIVGGRTSTAKKNLKPVAEALPLSPAIQSSSRSQFGPEGPALMIKSKKASVVRVCVSPDENADSLPPI